jgi:hypothetical protein
MSLDYPTDEQMARSNEYREDLIQMIGSFEFSLCEDCGHDIDHHTFAPDPLGNPHQFCLLPTEE